MSYTLFVPEIGPQKIDLDPTSRSDMEALALNQSLYPLQISQSAVSAFNAEIEAEGIAKRVRAEWDAAISKAFDQSNRKRARIAIYRALFRRDKGARK